MRSIYAGCCYRRHDVAWSVCVCVCVRACVCVCVVHDREPCKTAEPIEMPSAIQTRVTGGAMFQMGAHAESPDFPTE